MRRALTTAAHAQAGARARADIGSAWEVLRLAIERGPVVALDELRQRIQADNEAQAAPVIHDEAPDVIDVEVLEAGNA